jgi:hypothetical protein
MLLLLAGCSAQGRLAGRAADYYSFLAGHSPRGKISSFYSPAYRKLLGADGVKQHNAAIKSTPEEARRYPKAGSRDVATRIEGRFALTVANPGLGDVYANQRGTKWVKVGMGWYLFLGSDAERQAYGEFPVGLAPPKFSGDRE